MYFTIIKLALSTALKRIFKPSPIKILITGVIGIVITICVINAVAPIVADATGFQSLDSYGSSYGINARNPQVVSQGQQAILDWAKVIAEYMNQYQFRYRLSSLTVRYNVQKYGGGSCCTTYVSWVLQEAGYLKHSEHTNYHWTLKEILDTKSEWERQQVTDERQLHAGDIVIYEGYDKDTGKHIQHSNICAGYDEDKKKTFYWDAGDGSNGAFKGKTKTHWMKGYNCSYTLRK